MAKKNRQLKAVALKKTSTEKVKDKQKIRGIRTILFAPLKIFSFLVPSYFKNSFKELVQVSWPSRRETLRLTLSVFMFAIVFGLLITVIDFGLSKLFKEVLIK